MEEQDFDEEKDLSFKKFDICFLAWKDDDEIIKRQKVKFISANDNYFVFLLLNGDKLVVPCHRILKIKNKRVDQLD